MKIVLANKSKDAKVCKIGFSWTTLFFGWIVPIFRKDYKSFMYQLLFGILTFNLSNIFFAFTSNSEYIKSLLNLEYLPTKKVYIEELLKHKIIVENNIGEVE